jgi:hypothetical protein
MGGKLWTPVVVAPGNQTVRVSTNNEAVEFRPRRLRWIAADTFVITGLGLRKGPTFQRWYLRFKSPGDALQAATIIKRNPFVLEEPLVPIEEFPVQVRYLVTSLYVMVQLYALLFRIVLVGIFFAIFAQFGAFGLTLGILFGIFYFGIFLFGLLVRNRRRVPGWIRFDGRSIAVRTAIDWSPVIPKLIEWKNPNVIVLRGRGTKHELFFPTTQDLTTVVTKIRTAFPQVQEILSRTYRLEHTRSTSRTREICERNRTTTVTLADREGRIA